MPGGCPLVAGSIASPGHLIEGFAYHGEHSHVGFITQPAAKTPGEGVKWPVEARWESQGSPSGGNSPSGKLDDRSCRAEDECVADRRIASAAHQSSGATGSSRRDTIKFTCEAAGHVSSVASATRSQGETMAKALYGYVGHTPDRRMLDEVTRLRAEVQSLEFEVTRLRAENDRLSAELASAEEVARLSEPALT